MFDKSPFNYIGNKYKILPQIFMYFPKEIDVMVDLFAGGCDVCSNIKANKIYANDINHFVIDIMKEMQNMELDKLINYIENTIDKNNLSLKNKEEYLLFRKKYNNSVVKNPLDLFILICYAFNHQFRFNSKHEFNTPFGKDRSSFNSNIKNNLIKFHKNIKDIKFTTINFKEYDISNLTKNDFLYADPPYTITTGSYNDGKRGFEGWSSDDDIELFKILDKLNEQGCRFALSNVSHHKGLKNDLLIKWMEKYNVHDINYNYNNSNYHTQNTDKITREILVTNY